MRRIFATLFFVCIAAASTRAEMMCTEMWCTESLMADLKADIWPQGDYTFTVTTDEKTVICKAHLPFNGCEDNAVQCDGAGVSIGASGCAMPPETHSFSNITVTPPPAHILMAIEAPQGRRFTYDSPVDIHCGYPNGAQCDKHECCSASLEIPVKWQENRGGAGN